MPLLDRWFSPGGSEGVFKFFIFSGGPGHLFYLGPVEAPGKVDLDGLYYSLVSGALFALVCHLSFKRLALRQHRLSFAGMDQKVNSTISRLSMAALVLFAVNIYFYRLHHLMGNFHLFQWIPTLEALVFLGIFLFYLVLIWNAAYGIQKRYFPGDLTKKSFVFSNIAFALPALLPWFCLSLSPIWWAFCLLIP